MNFMLIFDIVIVALGIYVIYSALKMRKDQQVPTLFVTKEEMERCNDVSGFVGFLHGKAALFGGISILFGMECLVDDLLFALGTIANVIALVVFVGAWIWFSYILRQGRKEFF